MSLDSLKNSLTILTPLLKIEDVARTLNVSLSFAYQLLSKGDLPVVRLGRARRVREIDLRKYIEDNLVHNK